MSEPENDFVSGADDPDRYNAIRAAKRAMTPALEPADVELVKRLREIAPGQSHWLSEVASRIEALAHQLGEMQRKIQELEHREPK